MYGFESFQEILKHMRQAASKYQKYQIVQVETACVSTSRECFALGQVPVAGRLT